MEMNDTDNSILECFDLAKVIPIIVENNFKKVVIQFPDDYVHYSVNVYLWLESNLRSYDVSIFITADSTYGSSSDDISAAHVDGDVLLYFGSDLSSSSSLPVVVIPFRFTLDVDHCTKILVEHIERLENTSKSILVMYDPCYFEFLVDITSVLEKLYSVSVAKLPNSSNLSCWSSSSNFSEIDNSLEAIGGLLVDPSVLNDQVVVYIGSNREQYINIVLRLSSHMIVFYNPSDESIKSQFGFHTIEFRERYGGVCKVKDAELIGIIVGSMGMSDHQTKGIIHRLQTLIEAARKQCYVFVMGRINESKLANFPDVDVFCLIANDDVAVIRPKTFHVPVITPFELELGLGARDWESTYKLDIRTLLGNGEEDLKLALEKVVENLPENPIDSDSESESGDLPLQEHSDSAERVDCTATAECCRNTSTQMVNASENRLIDYSSNIASERYKKREFKGLVPTLSEMERSNTTIQDGHFGTSLGYSRANTFKDSSNSASSQSSYTEEDESGKVCVVMGIEHASDDGNVL